MLLNLRFCADSIPSALTNPFAFSLISRQRAPFVVKQLLPSCYPKQARPPAIPFEINGASDHAGFDPYIIG